MPKTRFFGLHFPAENMSLNSTTSTYVAPKATEIGKIVQNNGHYAVKAHSRSSLFVPIESPSSTSFSSE